MKIHFHTVMLLALFSLPLYGAEEEADNTRTAQPTLSTDDASDEVAADESAQEPGNTDLTEPPSDEDFVPSVRITEDLPVAFPVDI